MIIEVDFDFLIKHKMNIEQYLLCYVLQVDKDATASSGRDRLRSGSPIAVIYKYTEGIQPLKTEDMRDLIDRGFLEHTGDRLVPDLLQVTDKFKQEIFNHWSNFEQLFAIYPSRIDLGPNKGSYSLKSLDKPFEEMAKYYVSVVRTKTKHRRILDIITWAKEKDLINMGIQKFIYQRFWKELEKKYEIGESSFDNRGDFEVLV